MLHVDLDGAADGELETLIAARCAQFGSVLGVHVVRTPTPRAVVEMATGIQAIRVCQAFGEVVAGVHVTIALQQITLPPPPPPPLGDKTPRFWRR